MMVCCQWVAMYVKAAACVWSWDARMASALECCQVRGRGRCAFIAAQRRTATAGLLAADNITGQVQFMHCC
jgi:hypothetical protein